MSFWTGKHLLFSVQKIIEMGITIVVVFLVQGVSPSSYRKDFVSIPSKNLTFPYLHNGPDQSFRLVIYSLLCQGSSHNYSIYIYYTKGRRCD